MLSKKAQAASEFIVIFVFIFILISIIMGFVGQLSLDLKKEETQKEIDNFAQSIISEFEVLENVEPGYSREIVIESYEVNRFNITFDLPYLILQDLDKDEGEESYVYEVPTNYTINTFEDALGNLHLILTKPYNCDFEEETLTSYLNDCNTIEYVDYSSFQISFENSRYCPSGYMKLIGVSNNFFSHAQISSLGTYNWSLCIRHNLYPLSNTCTDTYDTLFYLGDINNSHIWSDTATAAPFLPYNWQQICMSSSDINVTNISFVYSDTPQLGYACLASFVGNYTYGGASIGPCLAGLNRIWVRLLDT